jgi:hypothetical protein
MEQKQGRGKRIAEEDTWVAAKILSRFPQCVSAVCDRGLRDAQAGQTCDCLHHLVPSS